MVDMMKDTSFDPVIDIKNLSVNFRSEDYVVRALRGVSLKVHESETYTIVGESGYGKSTLAFSIMGYLGRNGSIAQGEIIFVKHRLQNKTQKELSRFRGIRMCMVYQEPLSSLNPSIVVGEQIAEVLRIRKRYNKKKRHSKQLFKHLKKCK